MKRIVSFNVNGLRAAQTKGLSEWLKAENFDVVCFQETKMDATMADPDYFQELGYKSYWHCAQKKGYSGVLTITKEEPKQVQMGFGIKNYDDEGRIICLDFGSWTLANCYFPSGSAGEERHDFKMNFLNETYPWFKKLVKDKKNVILVGDYNIVHQDLDIHNPTRKDNPSGFRPEERAWMDTWYNELFDDAFRLIHPDQQAFSWWSYRAGSYQKDKGWRIDYQSISKSISKHTKAYKHHKEIRFSDHCPIEATYDLDNSE
ncbi:MAG: exodeoxyribonuclease III [Saprospiraceae bacterium]|nr:exodeoxyribonuclease III [Saprospiraceae bacterium]